MRAAAYARVSSAAQRDRDTIAGQLRELPAYVTSRGWELVGTYVDDGKTAAGSLGQRTGMLRLMADAAAGLLDVVVVVDFDRITRADMAERVHILSAFAAANVQIVSSGGKVFDLATEHGELMATLEGHAAAAWLRKHKERIVRGKIEAARRGRKPAGPTLYGYRYDRATGVWSVHEGEAVIVRECFRRVAAGESCHAVCCDLQDRGELRPRGGRWNRGRVWTLVSNRGYVGVYMVDKARGLTVPVPPIIDDEIFAAAQAMLPANRGAPRAPRTVNVNLIEGIARCGECGRRMGITGSKSGQRYYLCVTHRASPRDREARGWERCGNRMRRVEDLDALVWSVLLRVLERPDLAAAARDAERGAAAAHDWEAELAGYERQLTALERAEAVILDRFRRGRISEGALDQELATAGRQRDLLRRNRDLAAQELASARRSQAEADALSTGLDDLRALAAHATARQRQELARILVPGRDGLEVTVGRDHVEVAGRLGLAAPGVVRESAAASSAGRSDGMLFRVVA